MKDNDNLSAKQDKELVVLLTGASQTAFGELYARYKRRLTYFCKQFLKDEIGAEDIVHDVFLQVWETREYLNPEMSFSGYVHTLAQNRILSKFRHSDVHARFARHILMNANDSTCQTEDGIIEKDYAKLLNELIESLSPRQREIFRLSRIQGLTYKEISEQLQISVDTVQEHASIALKKIKDQLMQHTDIHFR
jgi:RNA polymerase sigma-70 factor (ECF subfamily)